MFEGSMECQSANSGDVGCAKVERFGVVGQVLGNESRRRATVVYTLRGKVVFGCRGVVIVAWRQRADRKGERPCHLTHLDNSLRRKSLLQGH